MALKYCAPALLCAISWVVHAQTDGPQSKLSPEDIAFESRDLTHYGAGKVPTGVIQLQPQSSYYPPYAFVVDKKERVLSLWSAEGGTLKRLAVYPADIGKNNADKRTLGDKATPEGIYFLIDKYERAALDYEQYGSRAFPMDYPNFFDRLEKKTGSGIWLHAVPDTVPLTRGSRGCVVVRDEVIKTLHPYYKAGLTPIIVQSEVEFRDPAEQNEFKKEFDNLLAQWQKAWQSKDLDAYLSYYHENFRGQGMKIKEWRRHKEKLNATYNDISVALSRPVIFEHKNQYVVRFFQHYRSDQYEDFGEKILHVTRVDGELKIIGEDWNPQPRLLAMEEIQRHSIASIDCAKDKDGCKPSKEPAL